MIWITLTDIETLRISRWYSVNSGWTIQLHIFVDATELAYAAVAYFHVSTSNDVKCALVQAKVKVSPKQPVSIPRMELMAAVSRVRLATQLIVLES